MAEPQRAQPEEPLLAGLHEAVRSDPLVSLDAMQRVAASASLGPILVNAAPGTGKSYLLVRRVAYLITELGVPAYQCAVIASSEERARHLRQSLDELLGAEGREVIVSGPDASTDVAHLFIDDLPFIPEKTFRSLVTGRDSNTSIMATGDPDSVIDDSDDWRAFDMFGELFPQSHMVRLSRNHRSPAAVVTAMSQIIEPVTRVPGRMTRSQRTVSEGTRIGRFYAVDEPTEREFLSEVYDALEFRGVETESIHVVSAPDEVDPTMVDEPHTVVLTGFDRDAWPNDARSRRLLYVALSRARGAVFISHQSHGSEVLDGIDSGLFVPFGYVPERSSGPEQPRLL
ncbi:UvrD-helicase domain-containing protein [Haloglycomyces albus]|uniref:UvrD-helicase domain-containing protein n=1 Tax=Haloglycomyces albus TaxID=526067 RepID=UPI00046C9EA9|nr:UvrD-helicase domain-containing protein [Haloglycomyces albus]